jgi:[ribosomal protein S5]-alanine N-acetyltransferase
MNPEIIQPESRYFSEGELSALRGLDTSDATNQYLAWLHNPDVADLTYASQFPPTISGLRAWIEQFKDSDSSLAFAVLSKGSGNHVGNATINRINWITGTADLGLMIGESGFADSKFITDVWTSVINYAFGKLGLRRLYTGIMEPATEYIKAAEALNFVQEGSWRQHSIVGGQLKDELLFGLLADEWTR